MAPVLILAAEIRGLFFAVSPTAESGGCRQRALGVRAQNPAITTHAEEGANDMYARAWWPSWKLAAIAASMGMAGSIFAPGQRLRPVRSTTPSKRVSVRSPRGR